MAVINFDSTNVTPSVAPEAKPAGWYVVNITASEMKPTSNGQGQYLETEMTILSPAEYAGQKLFDRFNLVNQNAVAVKIAYEQLSAVCHATGVIQVADSAQLHGRPLQVKISLRPAGPGKDGQYYDASNEVKGYKAVEGATIQQAPAFAPPPPPVQAAAPAYAPPAQAWAAPAQQTQAPVQQNWAPPAQQAPVQQPAPIQQVAAPVQQAAPAAAPPWAAAPVQQAAAPVQAAPVAEAAPIPVAAAVPPWMQQPAG